jgi:hypothetical protein
MIEMSHSALSNQFRSTALSSALDIEVRVGSGLAEGISHLSLMRSDVCAYWLGLVMAQKIAAPCISVDHISKGLCHPAPRLV